MHGSLVIIHAFNFTWLKCKQIVKFASFYFSRKRSDGFLYWNNYRTSMHLKLKVDYFLQDVKLKQLSTFTFSAMFLRWTLTLFTKRNQFCVILKCVVRLKRIVPGKYLKWFILGIFVLFINSTQCAIFPVFENDWNSTLF